MDVQQNSTQPETPASVPKSDVELVGGVTAAQDEYIAFTALGGLIPDLDSDKAGIPMTAKQLAAKLGVERTTMWYWRKSIPDFWDRVAAKRREIGGKDRVSQVWNGLFLKGAAGDTRAGVIYLANFDPDFRMPMQQVKHEAGDSWGDVMAAARRREREASEKNQTIVEGEIVDDKPTQINPLSPNPTA